MLYSFIIENISELKMYKRSLFVFLFALASLSLAQASTQSLESKAASLGFSNEIINELNNTNINKTSTINEAARINEEKFMTEADSLQEQLTQLGYTRNITSIQALNAENIRKNINKYWSRQGLQAKEIQPVEPELMSRVAANIERALTSKNYKIIKLELKPTTVKNLMRGDIRVARKVKFGTAYKQIQNNLTEVKKTCLESATIEGICYLSEMTTFIVENPRDQHYYERTILK